VRCLPGKGGEGKTQGLQEKKEDPRPRELKKSLIVVTMVTVLRSGNKTLLHRKKVGDLKSPRESVIVHYNN